MSRWRDLLQPERSTDRHRELAHPLQHQAAALCTWLSTTRTTGDQTTARPDAHHELTSHSAWYKISVRPQVSGSPQKLTFVTLGEQPTALPGSLPWPMQVREGLT